MFFTENDYKKIYGWIQNHSIKDSEFHQAKYPLSGRELITVVQDKINKNIRLDDFISQLGLISNQDILNISYRFDKPVCSLGEAVSIIPSKIRKVGQIITFCDLDRGWKIYQFKGDNLTKWFTLSYWEDIIERIASIAGAVPDEEDITVVEEQNLPVLKLKDKQYEPEKYSGLGRVYLRKNPVVIEGDTVCDREIVNLLTQDMVGDSNVIYIVQYDYDLNGETIIIPNNCILDFRGGSFVNGYINYNGTTIDVSRIRNSCYYFSTIYNRPLWWNGTYWMTWADNVEVDENIMLLQTSINSNVLDVYIIKDGENYYLASNYSEDFVNIASEANKNVVMSLLNKSDDELYNITDIRLYVSDDSGNHIFNNKVTLSETGNNLTIGCDIFSMEFNDDDTVTFNLNL